MQYRVVYKEDSISPDFVLLVFALIAYDDLRPGKILQLLKEYDPTRMTTWYVSCIQMLGIVSVMLRNWREAHLIDNVSRRED